MEVKKRPPAGCSQPKNHSILYFTQTIEQRKQKRPPEKGGIILKNKLISMQEAVAQYTWDGMTLLMAVLPVWIVSPFRGRSVRV